MRERKRASVGARAAKRSWGVSFARLMPVIAGCLGFGIATGGAVGEVAGPGPDTNQRSPQDVPASWRDFAQRVQARCRDWLAADDDLVKRFHVSMENLPAKDSGATAVVAKLWIAPDGKIDRADFEGLDSAASVNLRAILMSHELGEQPPADMLQPLRLKLSLGSKS